MSSPYGPTFHEFDVRFENRNSEEEHAAKLAASLAQRLKINEGARRAHENYLAQQDIYRTQQELHLAQQKQLQLEHKAAQETERIRLVEAQAKEEAHLREVREREIELLKPPVLPPPPAIAAVAAPEQKPTQPATQPTASQAPNTFRPPITPQQTNSFAQAPPQSNNAFHQAAQQAASSNPFAQPLQAPTPTPTPTSTQAAAPQPTPTQSTTAAAPEQPTAAKKWTADKVHGVVLQRADVFIRIHDNLKKVRARVKEACKAPGNEAFKAQVDKLRREIRMKLGQISTDKSQNKNMMNRISACLEESLHIASPGINPSAFMQPKKKRDPVEGAANNGAELPLVFIYMINLFAKYTVEQLAMEAGAKGHAIADPIGIIVVQVFAKASLLWRGESLIDIFMAKMRKACPTLFGMRGSEKTEEGRARLGWLRVNPKDKNSPYITDDQHAALMMGLASGYAAISLRDFSRSSLKNPWLPSRYWHTISSICNTPSNECSDTQYYVLRGLIDGYEGSFLKFYGNAARGALKAALVDFPAVTSAPDSTVDPQSGAVGGVKVLADKLAQNGINLRT